MNQGQRVASFDIGSNTVLMLVAERQQDGHWVRIADEMAITRISEGLDKSGTLAPLPVERTLAVLETMAANARSQHACNHIVATGTAPFRRSMNGAVVAAQVSAAIGTELRVVTGEEEAELVLAASRIAFPTKQELVVVDIGGASTEVVVASDDVSRISLDIGSVRLTERFLSAGEYDRPAIGRLQAGIAEALAEPSARDVIHRGAGLPLVGVAGTVTTLASIHLELAAWDDNAVHGLTMTRADVARLAERLPAMTVEERCALPGMPRPRADVIAAGACLLSSLMEALRVDEIVVSDRGIRWGRLAWISG